MDKSENTTASIKGIYTRTITRDWQNGFTVFVLQNEEKELITCSGILLETYEGSRVYVVGTWEQTKYGMQLQNVSVSIDLSQKEVLRQFLGDIPGVGYMTANALLEVFGDRLYDVAMSDTGLQQLTYVPGISTKRAQTIIDQLRKSSEKRDLFEFVLKYGGNYITTQKIFAEHGKNSVSKLRADPYKVGGDAGLSLSACDKIGADCGIKPYDFRRIAGVLKQVLFAEANKGNTYLLYSEAVYQAKLLLGVTAYTERVAAAAIGYVARCPDKGFVLDDDKLYLAHIYKQERHTAFSVKRLMQSAHKLSVSSIGAIVEKVEKQLGVKYDAKQKEAFNLLLSGGIGIVTGGPGTGKTTVIKGLLTAYQMLCPNNTIKLCAPTGRASQRMKESTGMEATTIHRILEYKPFGESYICKNEADPIDADFLFVDEASMISIEIADMLFSAVRSGTTVILTGDIDQLPAIGAGNVLHDLIDSGVVPVVALTKTFRQAGESAIIDNAKRICTGVTALIKAPDFEIQVLPEEDISAAVQKKYLEYNDPKDIFSVQVLTPARRKTVTSSNSLNRSLQEVIPAASQEVLKYGSTNFRLGDRVMFMRNNYAAGYFNGDVGIITAISGGELTVKLENDYMNVQKENMDDLSLAFATTVHKAQGSEYATAIVVLPKEPKVLLQRAVLYTAITRAKKRVVLLAAEGTIANCILCRKAEKRHSYLCERLQNT